LKFVLELNLKSINMKPKQTRAIGIAVLLLAAASTDGSTILATLSSQDRIIGGRQSGGDPLGYYPDSQLTVGVAGGEPNRVNTNTVIGFILPTLNPGESLSAAAFAITAGGSSGINFTVGLFGLTTEDPDDSGTALFSQTGDGDVKLANSGGLNFAGTLSISNSSRVMLATAGNHGLTSIGAGSFLELQNGASVSGAISNSGMILDSSTTGTVTLSGPVSGSGSLSKTSASTLVLAGDNTYNGTTTVTGGKLMVTGSIGNSAVTVSGSGTILATDAAATIGATLVIDNGAILAAGDAGAAGIATVNAATTFNDGSIFSWDISADAASYDRLISSSLVDGGSSPRMRHLRILSGPQEPRHGPTS
jgi:autotransporter-associated beta strand protein